MLIYNFDNAGVTKTDSNTTKWAYDSKGRETSYVVNYSSGVDIDSAVTTYGTGYTIYDGTRYSHTTLWSKSHTIQYFNDKGLIDSSITSYMDLTISNGDSSYTNYSNTSVTVFYYDQNGNDTLDVLYSVASNARIANGVVRKTFIDNLPSMQDTYYSNGIRSYSNHYSGLNIISDTEYSIMTGAPEFSHAYTYSNVLSGGFYGYTGSANLLSAFSETNYLTPNDSYSETITYTFDDAGRVGTATRKLALQPGSSRTNANTTEIYTYY